MENILGYLLTRKPRIYSEIFIAKATLGNTAKTRWLETFLAALSLHWRHFHCSKCRTPEKLKSYQIIRKTVWWVADSTKTAPIPSLDAAGYHWDHCLAPGRSHAPQAEEQLHWYSPAAHRAPPCPPSLPCLAPGPKRGACQEQREPSSFHTQARSGRREENLSFPQVLLLLIVLILLHRGEKQNPAFDWTGKKEKKLKKRALSVRCAPLNDSTGCKALALGWAEQPPASCLARASSPGL